jgi:hypothetical protein
MMPPLLGLIVAVLLIVLFVKLALGLLGIVIGLALGVGAYFVAEKLVGQGR